MRVTRLTSADRETAVHLFALMAAVFEAPYQPLSVSYVERLLDRRDFWVLVATRDGELLGGLTAHTLPMTRSESSELFIYDLAVRQDVQRQGIGRALVNGLRQLGAAEGIEVAFVPAENEDTHALDFYRALGASESAVTFFVWSPDTEP